MPAIQQKYMFGPVFHHAFFAVMLVLLCLFWFAVWIFTADGLGLIGPRSQRDATSQRSAGSSPDVAE